MRVPSLVGRTRTTTSSRKPRIGVRAIASMKPSRGGGPGGARVSTARTALPCGGRASTMRHLRLMMTFIAAS